MTRASPRSTSGKGRHRVPLTLLLLGAAALLSSGFVHRRVQQRRSRHQRLRSRLEYERTTEKLARRSRRWRSPRHRRRTRGRGWDSGRSIGLQEQHYVFGSDGSLVVGKLSAKVIRQTLGHYNSQIASCLLQHGASDVTIKLQILGTGRVSVVTTNLAGMAARCVKGIILKVRFPARKGTRTSGAYRLKLN